ncbi:MAG: ATP-binding protein [Candidatus Magasanikbacteria bacterium]|nr:ATP-binding protein [Candidatus Magasanikbacteria bacterium]
MTELFDNLRKYNYWDGVLPEIGVSRTRYQQRISGYLGNQLIKVLVGQRRAGKSYLLRQIIHRLMEAGTPAKNIFYLNKELVEFDEVRTYEEARSLIAAYREKLKISGQSYIFLDEVQTISGWEKLVNSLAQNPREACEVFISGSNSAMLSGELATVISGRFVAIEVFPFSFSEFCAAYRLPAGKDSYLSYLRTGGLPELARLSGEEARRNYVAAVRDTIILKDIVERFAIKDAALLQDIFSFCVDGIGTLFSVNSIVNYLKSHHRKTNHETVANYASYLCDAFLIHETPRYDVRGRAVFARQRKYYLNDLAFRAFLSSGYDAAPGKLLENSIFLHFRSLGYRMFVGTVGKQEVDFVAEKDGERQYVQAAYLLADDQVVEREFGALEKIEDNYPKFVVSLDDASFGVRNGIRHLRPWELPEQF